MDLTVFAGKRLPSSTKVDNREPSHTEPDARLNMDTLVVRSAVPERVDQRPQLFDTDRSGEVALDDTGNSAHG